VAVAEPAPPDETPAGPLLRLVRDRRIAFILVGGFNTVNGFLVFVLFHILLGDGFVRYMAAMLGSHVVAVLCAFVLHRRFVFRVRGHVLLDLARFEMVNLGALAANAVLLPVFVEIVGTPVVLGQLLAGGLTVVGSYAGHSLFSFRRPTHDLSTEHEIGAR
jgi:putative flippase GtrA